MASIDPEFFFSACGQCTGRNCTVSIHPSYSKLCLSLCTGRNCTVSIHTSGSKLYLSLGSDRNCTVYQSIHLIVSCTYLSLGSARNCTVSIQTSYSNDQSNQTITPQPSLINKHMKIPESKPSTTEEINHSVTLSYVN